MKKLTLGFIFAAILALNVSAETKYLVIGNNADWKTDVEFISKGETGATDFFTLTTAVGFPGNTIEITPRSIRRIENIGSLQNFDFGVRAAELTTASAETQLTFRNSSYFVVPALSLNLSEEGDTVELSGITNSGDVNTDIVAFNLENYESYLTVDVLGWNYDKISGEILSLKPGLNFIRLKSEVFGGSVRLYNGTRGTSFSFGARVVGFFAVGRTGTPKIIPF